MKANKLLTSGLLLLLPLSIIAQAETAFNGIHLKQSVDAVRQKLTPISGNIQTIRAEAPVFPLARQGETHLVCHSVQLESGLIDRAVFTFADNELSYIEARGNAYETFARQDRDSAQVFMGYEVYFEDKLFLNKQEDAVWIMTEEAVHPNLFTWKNPYLGGASESVPLMPNSGKIPEFIEMGGSFDKMKTVLEQQSSFLYEETLDGSDPNAQVQLNCFGIPYLGFPRKVEARFGDGVLNVVWILTGKGEEARVRAALVEQFGQPVFENEAWEIYNDWQVGLRKDKPEVLLMEKEIGQFYRKEYFNQQ
ncbi:hypothetical protein ACT6NV_08565 [Robiginitalea sp. IMCC44478]|uniref:hypothetical protein n=1 Tax=Robiginitalea sp. IMCC44478 TaxID=3459122 RepID=UPI0040429244